MALQSRPPVTAVEVAIISTSISYRDVTPALYSLDDSMLDRSMLRKAVTGMVLAECAKGMKDDGLDSLHGQSGEGNGREVAGLLRGLAEPAGNQDDDPQLR